MSEREYVFRVESVERVIDGDTFWLRLDVGFRQTQLTEIRLLGYDCPETRQGSAFERREGAQARDYADDWFAGSLGLPGMNVWVRTEKDPDSFGRWLGEIWAQNEKGEFALGRELALLDLATVWPTRWHETYDPERSKA